MKKLNAGKELVKLSGGVEAALQDFKHDRDAVAEILLAHIAGRDPAEGKRLAGALK